MGLRHFLIPFALLLAAATFVRPATAQEQSGREFTECDGCPPMVGIPAGRFVMGSPAREPGRFDSEGPQHVVSVKAFALGKYDVTSEEFLTFLKDTGYQPKPCNTLLNMKWQSLGGGFAYPPYSSEPRLWPASGIEVPPCRPPAAWSGRRLWLERPLCGGSRYLDFFFFSTLMTLRSGWSLLASESFATRVSGVA